MKVVERALDILEAILNHGDEVSLADLADMTGLNISAVRRFASTLARRGYLYQKQKGGKYSLGVKLLQFGNVANVAINIRELALPFLKRLCDDTSETVLIAALNGLEAINIATILPKQVLRVIPELGTVQRFPLHCTSLGKILLAYLPDRIIEETISNLRLDAYTDKTITDKTKFKSEIETVRRDGVAFDDEEYSHGIRSVAVPVRGANGNVLATVCLVSPAVRISRLKMRQLVPTVKSCALSISRSLGYKGE